MKMGRKKKKKTRGKEGRKERKETAGSAMKEKKNTGDEKGKIEIGKKHGKRKERKSKG